MKTRDFRVQQGGKKADLWIYEEIGDWFGTSARWIKQQLDDSKGVSEIVLHLNSPGGMVTESAAIYNLLRNNDAKVRVQVEGIAASGASLIAMAGDEIVIYEGALFMVHGAFTVTRGFAADHRATAQTLEMIGESMADIYSKRTRQAREVVIEKMTAETWFSAKEAVAFGLADSMVEGKQAAAASFDVGRFQFKHAPKALTAASSAEPQQQLNLQAVEAAREETNMKSIAKALGLSEGASEGEIVAAIHDRSKETEKFSASVKALESAVGKSGSEALGAIKAHVANTERLAEAEKQLKAMADKAESDERASLLAKGKAEGKITPAEVEFWGSQPVDAIRAYLEVASAKVPKGEPAVEPAASASTSPAAAHGEDDMVQRYAAMSGPDRQELKASDAALFNRMRTAWHAADCPAPSDSTG